MINSNMGNMKRNDVRDTVRGGVGGGSPMGNYNPLNS